MVRSEFGMARCLDSKANIALENSVKAQYKRSKQEQSHTKGVNKGTPNVDNESGQRKALRSQSDP